MPSVFVPAALFAAGNEIAWVEDFADDPLAAGRFSVPPILATFETHVPARFTYDAGQKFLTAHYNTLQSTAWYMRPIDPTGGRVLGRYDDFEFTVTFRVRSQNFFAYEAGFAQIAWGLVNAQTTGDDRAGGSAGPYAFDCLTFDYFPNVSPLYGGPTLGPTVIHSDDGAGFFANIDFAFGAESTIDAGDETLALDTVYTARVAYRGADESATVTLMNGPQALLINAVGGDGPGGPDGDSTTIQTVLLIDNRFAVDSFAITAWEDTFSPLFASVIADVDIMRIEFYAPAVLLGDLNLDGLVNGDDVAPFVSLMLSADPDPSLAARGDFVEDGTFDLADVSPFVQTLVQP